MTQLIAPHDVPVETVPRLALGPDAQETGAVDGGWWPETHALAKELPAALAELTSRLGVVERVLYSLSEWSLQPSRLIIDGRSVKLDGYRYQPSHTIYVVGRNGRRVVLLVVPADTEPEFAHHTLTSAAAPGDSSSIDALLGTGLTAAQRSTAAQRGQQRWDSDGGAPADGRHPSLSPAHANLATHRGTR